MRYFLAVILTVLTVFSSFPALAANLENTELMSSETLNVVSHLDDYNETKVRENFAAGSEGEILFAQDGSSDFAVVYPDGASDTVIEAAEELSAYLNRIIDSDGLFPTVNESSFSGGHFISIGHTMLAQNADTSQIKDDGYMIEISDRGIFILTLDDENIYNGVYGFLEDKLECMFVREDYDYVPVFPTIYFEPEVTVSNPDFAWRKVFQYEVAQNGWYRKLKNNGAVADNIEQNEGWGTWCHSSFTFVSPEEYQETHPEYFTYNEAGEPQQLCLTNPEIYPIIEEKMAELIASEPDKKYWDFSLNDNYYYCTCENCAAVLEKTGSMMGTMLPIINSLAQRFPDKIISTLAYFYNETVPKGMVCEKNVNIVLCPINTGQLYSYQYGATEKALKTKNLVESWSAVCSSLMIWDYVVDFQNLLMPYPNFDVQKDNHAFYIDNNVKAVFHQGSREKNDEMARLRSYVLSKQLWNNSTDVSALIAKYLKVTYGAAAVYVADYLDMMNRELKRGAEDLDLYDSVAFHSGDYLSKKNNDKYLELINAALKEVEGDERITGYLEEIKINILYAVMNEDNLLYNRKKDAFSEFTALMRTHDIEQPHEVGVTMEEYISSEYPVILRNTALKITACVAAPIVGAGIAAAVVFVVKKVKNKKKNKITSQ